MGMIPIVLAPTVTKLPDAAAGAVIVTGSHGGAYVGRVAARAGVRALIAHDAGIGRDAAGIGALALLEVLGIAAAAASHLSCRIGDTDDMMRRGVISRTNAVAAACGVNEGMRCDGTAALLRAAPLVAADVAADIEARQILHPAGARRALVLVDSASLVDPEADDGAVIVTGSHGGLVASAAAVALKARAFGAAFNDAGIGIEDAGIGRLAALQTMGVAAITIAASSARIGAARSTFEDGIVSARNALAAERGAVCGEPARTLLLAWTRR